MRRPILNLLKAALLAALAAVPAVAQRHAGAARSFSARSSSNSARRFTGDGFVSAPFFYPDYDYSEPNPPGPTAPPVAFTAAPAERKLKATPLLIEWQGDRYVRYGGIEEEKSQRHADYSQSAPTNLPAPPQAPAGPAILVYRDGRRQEISTYAIANGVIYIEGADWQSSASAGWQTGSKKPIPLSALDPQATLEANRQRGVNFLLPTASNVVIASF